MKSPETQGNTNLLSIPCFGEIISRKLTSALTVSDDEIFSLFEEHIRESIFTIMAGIETKGPKNKELRSNRSPYRLIRNGVDKNSKYIDFSLYSFGIETPFRFDFTKGVLTGTLSYNFLSGSTHIPNLEEQIEVYGIFPQIHPSKGKDVIVPIYDDSGITQFLKLINLINFSLFIASRNSETNVFFLGTLKSGLNYETGIAGLSTRIMDINSLSKLGLYKQWEVNDLVCEKLDKFIHYLNVRHLVNTMNSKGQKSDSTIKNLIHSLKGFQTGGVLQPI